MARALKTFSQLDPQRIDIAQPKTNQLKLDLAGLNLTNEQIDLVRQEAVKAAMQAAAGLLAQPGLQNVFDSFGTFSTFSTFSTFGSGVGNVIQPGRLGLGAITPGAQGVIDRIIAVPR